MRLINKNIHIILSIIVICSYLILLFSFSQSHQPEQKKLINKAEQEIISTFSYAWYQTKVQDFEKKDSSSLFFDNLDALLNEKSEILDFDFSLTYQVIDLSSGQILHQGKWGQLSETRSDKIIHEKSFALTDSYNIILTFNNLKSKASSFSYRIIIQFALILGFFTFFVLLSIHKWRKNQLKSQMKTDYMYGVTHEMKSLLTTISLATEFIIANKGANKENEYKHIILEESKELMKMVQQVLNMAVLEKKKLSINYESIEIQSFIDDIIRSYSVKIENYNGNIHFTNEVTEEKFWADRALLKLALSNIIDNAIKYSSMHPIIHILATTENGYFVIKIKDNGIGIPKSHLNKIFKPTLRIKNALSKKPYGVGMGLYFVKQITKIHKGKIKVNSELNKGSEFCVYIPKYE
ncbi:MAG: HAMP domain-containing sensor histidine kinase [Bacteroidales bacterium]|nr:HAMP domain-containing sensor histidine kinase [Bacteroidales bacterium]MDY0215983.1 HAMP domain-containing sensor histidine kinase [Bacteroidales bacterium]